jgi:type III secretory pathway component EscV
MNNLLLKTTTSIFVISALLLTGCGSNSVKQEQESVQVAWVYDSTHSKAWNIAQQAGIKMPDMTIEEREEKYKNIKIEKDSVVGQVFSTLWGLNTGGLNGVATSLNSYEKERTNSSRGIYFHDDEKTKFRKVGQMIIQGTGVTHKKMIDTTKKNSLIYKKIAAYYVPYQNTPYVKFPMIISDGEIHYFIKPTSPTKHPQTPEVLID